MLKYVNKMNLARLNALGGPTALGKCLDRCVKGHALHQHLAIQLKNLREREIEREGPEKGVITKAVFSLEESLASPTF